MAQGASIHIGLNDFDRSSPAYQGVSADVLSGCWNDANSMEAIAEGQGFATRLKLLDSDATADRVLGEIRNAGATLQSGDILFVSYSGHGAQIPDTSGDESDSMDETWVLWDRMLLDDELSAAWDTLEAGVRVLLISDSCHSGTVSRNLYFQAPTIRGLAEFYQPQIRSFAVAVKTSEQAAPQIHTMSSDGLRVRGLSRAAATIGASNMQRLGMLGKVRRTRAAGGATVLLLSGCQDNQLSADGSVNGLFTEKLLQVWSNGAFTDGYKQFHSQILAQMPATQSPNYSVTGASNPAFEDERPFTVNPFSTEPDDGSGGQSTDTGSGDTWDQTDTGSGDTTDTGDTGSGDTWDQTSDTWDQGGDTGSTDTTDGASSNGSDDIDRVARDMPFVSGPQRVQRTAPPPTFSVHSGSNPYYAFEITTDPALFRSDRESGRTASNWYASWNDPQAPARYTGDRYMLPATTWERLRTAPRLYYRLCTSRTATSWVPGYQVSTVDDDGAHAPVLTIA